MQSKALQCFSCLKGYNLTNRTPKVLPQCGHTICNECLTKILASNSKECPSDKKKMVLLKPELFPLNFVIRSFIEESPFVDECSAHGEKIKWFCTKDQAKICAYCVFYGDHKGHEVKPLSDIKGVIQQKRKQLQTTLDDVCNYKSTIDKSLNGKRTELVKIMEDQFEQVHNLLKVKKQEMLEEVNAFFEQENKKSNYLFGENSTLRIGITNKLNELNIDFEDTPNAINVLADDVSHYCKIDHAAIYEYIEEINKKIKTVSDSLEESLDGQIELAMRFENPVKNFSEIVEKVSSKIVNLEELSAKLGTSLSSFSVTSCLAFIPSNNSLEIIATQKTPLTSKINTEDWKNMKELKFKLDGYEFTSQDLKILSLACSKLEQLESVKIDCKNQGKLLDDMANKLIFSMIRKPENLRELDINFGKTSITDLTVDDLTERILSKAYQLKSLKLCLAETNISSQSVKNLSKSLLPVMDYIETFSLSLARTKIAEETISQLFVSMPRVKQFELNLDCTSFSNAALEKFVNKTLCSMNELNTFVLWLYNTTVGDYIAQTLFNKIPLVKKLKMDLRGTNVKDESIKAFLKSKVCQSKALQSFDIKLAGSRVSEQMIQKLEKLRSKFDLK